MNEIIILGAGASGLALACALERKGFHDFIILEKESEAGGLCRSKEVDGAPFDIGGGHFLDVRRPKVVEFLFEYMPRDEWELFERNSKICVGEEIVNHPIEANIWQMTKKSQVEYLKSIAIAGCNLGQEKPDKFVDWIYWKLGKKIAEDYMLPYNRKMFSDELNELGTYWLEKLPNVSFEETLLSCLDKKAYGQQPGHTQFYYPTEYGYGEVWKRMADSISGKVFYNETVTEIDFETKTVCCESGKKFQASVIVSTIPWSCIQVLKGMPMELQMSIKRLKHSAIETRYFGKNLETDAHWIYYPDSELPYHRILVRHNFAKRSRGYWTETRINRTSMFNEAAKYSFVNDYAYPLNTLEKPDIMKELLEWTERHNVLGLGRWGEHQHYNSDVVVEKAIQLADRILISKG